MISDKNFTKSSKMSAETGTAVALAKHRDLTSLCGKTKTSNSIIGQLTTKGFNL